MSNQPKSSVREVLESIGRRPEGMTDEKDAVALLNVHLALVQGANEFDDLPELIKVRDGAQGALRTTFKVRTESPLARSHADMLLNALAPLERLIENRQKEERAKPKAPKVEPSLGSAPKVEAPKGDPLKVEAVAIPVVADPLLPPAQKGIRDAIVKGDLAAKLTDPGFRKDVMEWLETVGGVPDEGMKKELVAALRAAPPADAKLRQKIFEKAFTCELESVKTGDDGEEAADVPPEVLNKVVDIIETFPANHLPAKWKLNGVPGTFSSGTWIPEAGMAQMDYGIDDAPGFTQDYLNAKVGDPLEGTKCFDVMIRHEMGHAVHSTKNGKALTDTIDGGAWQGHGEFTAVMAVLDPLVVSFGKEFGEALKTPDSLADLVRPWLIDSLGEFKKGANNARDKLASKFLEDLIRVSPVLKQLTKRPDRLKATKDAVPVEHDLFKVIIQGSKSNPFFDLGSDPVAFNGRVYLDSGLGDDGWVSFDASTRRKMVSMYQYRAPGEWFAEFYATVNNANPTVRDKGKSAYENAYKWLKKEGLLIYND